MSAFTDRFEELEQRRAELELELHRSLAKVAEQTVLETDVSGEPYEELVQQLSEIESLRSGLAFMAFHFPDEAAVNELTIDAWDPKSGTAEFKATAVRIEKVG